ncbi:MAG: response regulator [candidate division KSB1 bacterium]|nr:response regulator [candidate division KSB1 bacterium]
MGIYHVIIVDDEPLARFRIRSLLEQDPEIEILAECETGLQAIDAIRTYVPDLIFLDIQLPEKDGFGIIEEIGAERMPEVIVVTAYENKAILAYKKYHYPYLLKPFDSDQFKAILSLAKRRIIESIGQHHDQGRQQKPIKNSLEVRKQISRAQR